VAELADEITLFKMLKANRVQVVFAEEYLFDYATKALAIADAAQTDIAPSEPPKLRCLVLSKTRFTREEMEKWRGLVERLKQDGTLATILAEYLPPKDIPPMMGEK
jgi:ABC-type amino acid transport substrate-binding protein